MTKRGNGQFNVIGRVYYRQTKGRTFIKFVNSG